MQRGSPGEDPFAQEHAQLGPVDVAARIRSLQSLRSYRRTQLGRDQLAQQVVMIVDRRHGQVDLGGPVRRPSLRRPAQTLELLDQFPPELIEPLPVRVGVERPFEERHHQRPARHKQQLEA